MIPFLVLAVLFVVRELVFHFERRSARTGTATLLNALLAQNAGDFALRQRATGETPAAPQRRPAPAKDERRPTPIGL